MGGVSLESGMPLHCCMLMLMLLVVLRYDDGGQWVDKAVCQGAFVTQWHY